MAPATWRLLTAASTGAWACLAVDDPWAGPAALAVCVALLLLCCHPAIGGRRRDAALVTAAACLAFAHAASVRDVALHSPLRALLDARVGGFAIEGLATPRFEGVVDIDGRLVEDAWPAAGGVVLHLVVDRIRVDSAWQRTGGGVSLTVAGTRAVNLMPRWTAGRRVRMPARLRRPSRYLDKGVPDFERARALRGITLVGSVKSGLLVEVTEQGWPWQELGARVRQRVRAILRRRLSPGGSGGAAVATAVLIGDRSGLDRELERQLQEAGTYHVLAISGGNVATLAGVLLGVLGLTGRRGRGATLLCLLLVLGYGGLVNGGASVTRATGMAALYLGVRLVDQRTAPVNAVALVTALMLLVQPMAIVDAGLWLTVGATVAILMAVERWRLPRGRVGGVVAGLLLASAAAEAAVMPVAAYVFERVSIAGVILNFAAVPCMSIVQLGAMAVVAMDACGLGAGAPLAGAVTEWAVSGLLSSGRVMSLAPWLSWRVPAPPLWLLAAYYASVAYAWMNTRPLTSDPNHLRHLCHLRPLRHRWHLRHLRPLRHLRYLWHLRPLRHQRHLWPVLAAAILAAWIAIEPWSLWPGGDGRLHVTVIDVGQGDAVLLGLPGGRRLLVDAGGTRGEGRFDMGERVVGPALRALGVRRLDVLVVTHGDPDHAGGARAVIRDFHPREVWAGVPVETNVLMRHLREEAMARGALWRNVRRGDMLTAGPVVLRVLHPPPPDWERVAVRNDDSVVLELTLGEVSVLLTGDIGTDVEADVAPIVGPARLRILKVPHHGSRTSSGAAFVTAVRPTIATIGVGRGNAYGHPVAAVVARYTAAGALILRTDRDGEIAMATDGRNVWGRTFTGHQWHLAVGEAR